MPGQNSRLQKAKLSHVQNDKLLHSLSFEDNCVETCSSWLLYLCNSWETMSNLLFFLSGQHSKSLSHTLKSFPTWTIKTLCCSSEYFLMGLLLYFKFSRIELFRDNVAPCFVFYVMSHVLIITCRFPVLKCTHIYVIIHTYIT